jgi:RNA polymerase sigma-70 factor (ECF subfamily)
VDLADRILVWRLRRRDRDACRELIERHHHRVYGYLRRLGAEPALAEDLTQECYTRAWQRIDSLREAASLRSWLLTIARNELLQHARGRAPEPLALDAAADLPVLRPSPEDEASAAQRDGRLHQAVHRLEPDLREAIVLHYFQDLSFREVGAVLGLPAGTAKSRVNRALERLRALLREKGEDHGEGRSGTAAAGH